MESATRVSLLPIGEFNTELIRDEFEAMTAVLRDLNAELIPADAATDEESARKSARILLESQPDLFMMIPFRGLSAPLMEAAARTGDTPVLIWPVQGRFALPSSSLAMGALREAGRIVELVYAPPDNPEIRETIRSILQAAKAYTQVRQCRIGVVGGLFPNLVSCRYDPQTIRSRLGASILSVPFAEVSQTMQAVSNRPDLIEQTRAQIAKAVSNNSADPDTLTAGILLHLALKEIAQQQHLDGFATECWSAFPQELGMNPCLGFIEDAYTLACEGDVMLCISLLIVRSLTGSTPYVGDLYDLDLDGNLTLVHCGAPAALAKDPKKVRLVNSQLAHERGFETVTIRTPLEQRQVTIFRFYGQNCDKLHLAMGELTGCDLSTNQIVKVHLAGNRRDFLRECLGNHYLVVAGDIQEELTLLCKWLGIEIIFT